MASFSGIPEIPREGLTDAQYLFLQTMKEQVELLIGSRNATSEDSRAVTKGDVTIDNIGEQRLRRVTAEGKGYVISGNRVADLDEFVKLVTDVQELANDVSRLRDTVARLIVQIRD